MSGPRDSCARVRVCLSEVSMCEKLKIRGCGVVSYVASAVLFVRVLLHNI